MKLSLDFVILFAWSKYHINIFTGCFKWDDFDVFLKTVSVVMDLFHFKKFLVII